MKKSNVFRFCVLTLVMISVFYTGSVFAGENIKGCTILDADIDVKIANTVHSIITVIKIVVPILLIIFGMLDLMKGITAQKEDEIKKGQQIFVKRLIAAAIIFFVVSIVQFLLSFVSDDQSEKTSIWNCTKCFLNGAQKDGTCK